MTNWYSLIVVYLHKFNELQQGGVWCSRTFSHLGLCLRCVFEPIVVICHACLSSVMPTKQQHAKHTLLAGIYVYLHNTVLLV